MKKIFVALGNDRPQILITLEDHVLQAIIGISEGMSIQDAMDKLYSQIKSLQDDLADDVVALSWFNLTSPPSDIPSTPLSMPNLLKDKFQVQG
jgi:hypothetical protein